MRGAISVRLAWCALLVGCQMSPWAHGGEPLISGEPGAPATETTLKQVPSGAARSNERPGSSRVNGVAGISPTGTAHPAVHSATPLSARSLSNAHVYPAKPGAASTARAYLPHRPGLNVPVRRRGMSATTLSANANRPSSGVLGTVGRSMASLKPSAGNGVVGGRQVLRSGMIGGPANSRSVIKAGIDGSAFHHRS
jgi:hypothetical protein